MSSKKQFLQFVLIFLSLNSCASNRIFWKAQSLLDDGRYSESLEMFARARLQNANDFKITRGEGIAYYQMKQYDKAIEKLREARLLEPSDGLAILYLGLVYEEKNQIDNAIQEYLNYSKVSLLSRFRNQIKGRIFYLNRKKINSEIDRAVQNEKNISVAKIPDNTIAVLYFKSLSEKGEFEHLIKGMVELLTIDLSKVRQLKVVERLKLERLLANLKLEKTELFDQATVPRFGKLLGANTTVTGSLAYSENADVQITALPIRTQTGETINRGVEMSGSLYNFMELEKKLVFSIIDNLGFKLTVEEIEAIQKTPTKDMRAFLHYCKGLDFEDRGLYDQARKEYETAYNMDHNFELVTDRRLELGFLQTPTSMMSSQEFENQIKTNIPTIQVDMAQDRLYTSSEKIISPLTPAEYQQISTRRPEEIVRVKLSVTGRLPE